MATVPGPDIDFERIRPFGDPPSRAGGFEELASILIKDGVVEWPDGTVFARFGNPDGGREGRGRLPNGDVWAWQAKYLFEFDGSTSNQITRSIRRVLDSEPSLKKYFVSLPIDFPAGDAADLRSAQTRWDDKVVEWKALAREKSLDVEFKFVSRHSLVSALTTARHEGRARYWFATDIFTPEWQHRRLDEAIAKAGPRYSASLHVEVDAVRAVDAVGREPAFVGTWQRSLADLREARRWLWRAPQDFEEVFDEALRNAHDALAVADERITSLIATAQSLEPFTDATSAINAAIAALRPVEDLLSRHCLTDGRYYANEAASLYSNVRNARNALWQAYTLGESQVTRAATEKRLLMVGRGGVGKTHLFCNAAKRRIESGRPTLLLLGEDFDPRSLLIQIGDLLHLDATAEEVVAALDAAGEAADCIGLLMIDALNESQNAPRWSGDLRALTVMVARYPRVGLVVSCRSELLDAVVGDHDLATVEHFGFAEATDLAVRRYAEVYGLEPPTFPVLNPEFSNGFFLRLTCEALSTRGATRFPFGSAGLVAVCDAFLEAVNIRLADERRGNFDRQRNVVSQAVNALALLGGGPFARDGVRRLTEELLPGRGWSGSLMRGLISEGVLIELANDRIDFGYQRLGDTIRARQVSSGGLEKIKLWLRERAESEAWLDRGVLAVLAVVVPEQYGVELFTLTADLNRSPDIEMSDFLDSLLLRAPEKVSNEAVDAVRRLLDPANAYVVDEVWDHLLRIACIPGHPLNAAWLHAHLRSMPLPARDRVWSNSLVGQLGQDETTTRRLIDWAWPHDLAGRTAVPDDVAALATQVLGWVLATPDRRVRDHATKALVSIAERSPIGFAAGVVTFEGVDDPYVIERLTAAACGAALRVDDPSSPLVLAQAVRALIGDSWPEHLFTRDYARRVYEAATRHGWEGFVGGPPYGSTWPVTTSSIEEIEVLVAPPEYQYGSIWSSLTGMGDFGRYIVEPSLRHIADDDRGELVHLVERAIFDRVLELGWTPELFRDIDQGRHGGHDGQVERFGKKYQWIAFYEMLGRIADNLLVRTYHDDPWPFRHPEELVSRDIDPTLLVRQPDEPTVTPWYSPVVATFPESVVDTYPVDMTGVPDPLGLVALESVGEKWLGLTGYHVWDQPLPLEVVALEVPRRTISISIRAYLASASEIGKLMRWARRQDWDGDWMPGTSDAHSALLGSYPNDPQWDVASGEPDPFDWWGHEDERPPGIELRRCAAWYGGTGNSRDASAKEETRGLVPTRALKDCLSISNGRDFEWSDACGRAVSDPSVIFGDPNVLAMRRDLLEQLQSRGMTIFWTAFAESALRTSSFSSRDHDQRWVTGSAGYILDGDRIRRTHAVAKLRTSGEEAHEEVPWTIRANE